MEDIGVESRTYLQRRMRCLTLFVQAVNRNVYLRQDRGWLDFLNGNPVEDLDSASGPLLVVPPPVKAASSSVSPTLQ